MNHARINRKRTEVLSHRWTQFDKAIDGLMNGTHSPEYVKERWDKLKPILPKRKTR
jgi:hypothetical protein